MNDIKKILISMPESLLNEVDTVISTDKSSRSEFIREAIKFYLSEKKNNDIKLKLIQGYQAMAGISAEISEYCYDYDSIQIVEYEGRLEELKDS